MERNDVREDLCKELRNLLDQWTVLQTTATATERDFQRIKAKIDHVCTILDSLQPKGDSRV